MLIAIIWFCVNNRSLVFGDHTATACVVIKVKQSTTRLWIQLEETKNHASIKELWSHRCCEFRLCLLETKRRVAPCSKHFDYRKMWTSWLQNTTTARALPNQSGWRITAAPSGYSRRQTTSNSSSGLNSPSPSTSKIKVCMSFSFSKKPIFLIIGYLSIRIPT